MCWFKTTEINYCLLVGNLVLVVKVISLVTWPGLGLFYSIHNFLFFVICIDIFVSS